jgi:HAD superfamily hydrolase (TIGR01509 family)
MNIFNEVAAVIFDHDGTLVDSEPVHLACWQRTLEPYGRSLAAQQYAKYLSGLPSINSASWLIEQFQLDIDPAALLTIKQAHLNRYLAVQACPIMAYVPNLIEYLWQRRIPMAIASGASLDEVTRSLKFHSLEHYFKATVTKEDVTANKPAPDVYLLAAQRLEVQASECIAIEDSDSGQMSALSAGMTCIRLDTPSQLPPHPRCHSIAFITALLNNT